MIYSFIMKILLVKDMFLLKILSTLIFSMIIILMKMILILLFMSSFWLGTGNLKNAKHLKKGERRINAGSMVS